MQIAVHCHAGFGRTGVAVACIMMVKDQLESSQVITFVRKRRPGSIQTAAQEKFIRKFERAHGLMMRVFPTNEALDLQKAEFPRSPVAHASLYQKTIKQTVRDQIQLLPPAEQEYRYLRFLHKMVYYATVALSSLAQQEYNIACLAITGLTKLVPKNNNWELDFETLSNKLTTSNAKSFRAKSFMVVTNSLSKVSEERIMDEIKAELNHNKWTRFMSVGDVVAGALRMSQESVKQMNRLTERVQSFKRDRSFVHANGSGCGGSAAAGAGSGGTVRRSFDSMNTASAKAAAAAKAAATAAAAVTGAMKNNSTGNLIGMDGSGNAQKPPVPNGVSTAANSNSGSGIINSIGNSSGAKSSGGGGGGVRATSPVADGGSKVVKMTSSRFRQNSLLENSDKEYNKSKKVASNTMAQLLLDWLETRTDPVFDHRTVDSLTEAWLKNYPNIGSTYTPSCSAVTLLYAVCCAADTSLYT